MLSRQIGNVKTHLRADLMARASKKCWLNTTTTSHLMERERGSLEANENLGWVGDICQTLLQFTQLFVMRGLLRCLKNEANYCANENLPDAPLSGVSNWLGATVFDMVIFLYLKTLMDMVWFLDSRHYWSRKRLSIWNFYVKINFKIQTCLFI